MGEIIAEYELNGLSFVVWCDDDKERGPLFNVNQDGRWVHMNLRPKEIVRYMSESIANVRPENHPRTGLVGDPQ